MEETGKHRSWPPGTHCGAASHLTYCPLPRLGIDRCRGQRQGMADPLPVDATLTNVTVWGRDGSDASGNTRPG
jgi:hypothetical protein